MKIIVATALLAVLVGCGESTTGDLTRIGETTKNASGHIEPKILTIIDGQEVVIGDKVLTILGTEQCSFVIGYHSCLGFSTEPGSEKRVSLSDGTHEIWTTMRDASGWIRLKRPDEQYILLNK